MTSKIRIALGVAVLALGISGYTVVPGFTVVPAYAGLTATAVD